MSRLEWKKDRDRMARPDGVICIKNPPQYRSIIAFGGKTTKRAALRIMPNFVAAFLYGEALAKRFNNIFNVQRVEE